MCVRDPASGQLRYNNAIMDEPLREKPRVKKLRNAFLTGLIVFFPVAATMWILIVLYNLILGPLAHPFRLMFGDVLPAWLMMPIIWMIMALIILTLGLLTRSIVGKAVIRAMERLFEHIPVVRSVYGAVKQVVDAFTTTHATGFRKVVLVKLSPSGHYFMGFVTREEWSHFNDVNGNPVLSGHLGVFVSTTPSPAHSLFMIVASENVIPLSISVEDAMRTIISAGVLGPRG